jgi:hypothetical protein
MPEGVVTARDPDRAESERLHESAEVREVDVLHRPRRDAAHQAVRLHWSTSVGT